MEKYLRLYAEPEAAALEEMPVQGQWANVVVIPACNESPGLLRSPPPCDGRSLLILVVNESGIASAEVSASNQALAAAVHSSFELLWEYKPESDPGFGLCLLKDSESARDLILVDRFRESHQLPAKGGVGLARKIGADLATWLIHRKHIKSTWIHCTDGDVYLPETYFGCANAVQGSSKYAALVYPFLHCDNPDKAQSNEVILATQLYEFSLHYYVAGMKFAGSPYAFHTIGSTMAVNAIHYAKVRGFPRREAGEDFYLLNKLAKLGTVLELDSSPDCEPIEITARRSDRVPFGTGAAVNKITTLVDPVRDFRFYHPQVFVLLKLWLEALPEIWQSQSDVLADSDLSIQHVLLSGLREIGTEKALGHAFRQSRDLDQFLKQMHTWFDAFRTLKLIHHLRDHQLPSISFEELLSGKKMVHLLKHERLLPALSKALQSDFLDVR